MANNCYFEIRLHGNENALARLKAVFEDTDPELGFVRFWPKDTETRIENGKFYAWGDCPWTDAYFWVPQEATTDHVRAGDVLPNGKTCTDIPDLWKRLGLTHAEGYGEEEGMEICNHWRILPDGSVDYYDGWALYVLQRMDESGCPEDYVDSLICEIDKDSYSDEQLEGIMDSWGDLIAEHRGEE